MITALKPFIREGRWQASMTRSSATRSLSAGLAEFQRRFPTARSTAEDDPIFVLAAGWRSGSTLLQRMLIHRCLVWGEPYGHSGLIDSLFEPIRAITSSWPEPGHFYEGEQSAELAARFIANLYPSPQDLLNSHVSWFHSLFAEPAKRAGFPRWGLKEVRLSADHAVYLRWLFPRAKFLFLIRNPYESFCSYSARRRAGLLWYKKWPSEPMYAGSFGKHWRDLADSFLGLQDAVDGIVVRYDQLCVGDLRPIEEYLGLELLRDAATVKPSDGGPTRLDEIEPAELIELDREVGSLAASLGYDSPLKKNASSAPTAPLNPRDCVILVPVGSHIENACESALKTLEARGYTVRRVRGYAAIDQARNRMASDALRDGFAETLWIDSDVAFEADDVERIRNHSLPVVCGIYPKKGKREIAAHVLPGTEKLIFGAAGGLTEILYGATGFLHVRREVYDTIQKQLALPLCNERFGRTIVPYFNPFWIREEGDSHWYLGEDFAFCERARQCGFKILADTAIRLWHIGSYQYGWEDAGRQTQRYPTFNFNLKKGSAKRKPRR